jgi:hypothetical protein
VESSRCGRVLSSHDVAGLSEGLSWLVQHPEEVLEMKRNSVAAASTYSWKAQEPTLLAAYESIHWAESVPREH